MTGGWSGPATAMDGLDGILWKRLRSLSLGDDEAYRIPTLDGGL